MSFKNLPYTHINIILISSIPYSANHPDACTPSSLTTHTYNTHTKPYTPLSLPPAGHRGNQPVRAPQETDCQDSPDLRDAGGRILTAGRAWKLGC